MAGETLAHDTLEHVVAPLGVGHAKRNAVVIAEVELGKIAVKVMLGAMLVHAVHTALEDRERAVNGVGVNGAVGAVHEIHGRVNGGAEFDKLASDLAVHGRFIDRKAGFAGDVVTHDGRNILRADVVDMKPAALAALTATSARTARLCPVPFCMVRPALKPM